MCDFIVTFSVCDPPQRPAVEYSYNAFKWQCMTARWLDVATKTQLKATT